MNDTRDTNEPRWLRLAATLRAEPDPATLARVRARLAARAIGPTWVRWLSRPVALAASAVLLIVSLLAGGAWLSAGSASGEADTSVMSTLLGDDGSYGLPLEHATTTGASGSESEGDTL